MVQLRRCLPTTRNFLLKRGAGGGRGQPASCKLPGLCVICVKLCVVFVVTPEAEVCWRTRERVVRIYSLSFMKTLRLSVCVLREKKWGR